MSEVIEVNCQVKLYRGHVRYFDLPQGGTNPQAFATAPRTVAHCQRHALHHLYASTLLDARISIKVVAEYLGHADPPFTLRADPDKPTAAAPRRDSGRRRTDWDQKLIL